MHGHNDIVDLLLNVYKADSNIRDNSGKKAWQYFQHSAAADTVRVRPLQYMCDSEDDWDLEADDWVFL
ncbi:ankyrin repeat domain-containing protein SOWAHB-like [Babylonia areolata]|uniref:ankyrin repeat domain-containing protein SOWAHB-like n=1 Tax=Babylonia areolata TaxID=304850 RepID=UPI003FCF8567